MALTVAATIAGLLIVGTTVSTWQAIRATQASRSEKEQRLTAQVERDKAQKSQHIAERAQVAENQERKRADEEKDKTAHLGELRGNCVHQ